MPQETVGPGNILDQQPILNPRTVRVYESLQSLYRDAQARSAEAGEEEKVHLEIMGATLKQSVLPESLRELLTSAGVEPTSPIRVFFEHFRRYERFEPSYSFNISWQRANDGDGADINSLHFSIAEQPSDSIISDFFGSDIKTASLSNAHFPYPDGYLYEAIPEQDLRAHKQHQKMREMVSDKEFQAKLIEGLAAIPFQYQRSGTSLLS